MRFTRLKIVIAINLVSRYPLYRALFMRETIHFSLHVSLDGKKRSTTRDVCCSSFIISQSNPATYIKLTKVYKISGTLPPSFTFSGKFLHFVHWITVCNVFAIFQLQSRTKLHEVNTCIILLSSILFIIFAYIVQEFDAAVYFYFIWIDFK